MFLNWVWYMAVGVGEHVYGRYGLKMDANMYETISVEVCKYEQVYLR